MTKRWKIVFMGTPSFAVPTLQALHDAGHHVVAVYSQPPRPAGRGQKEMPSPVHQLAESLGIPVYTPVSLKEPAEQQAFKALGAEIAVVAAYGLLLPKAILEAYPFGCINIHPSLLPRWRGAAPIQRAIMAGDAETGVVIMQMNEGLDTGDMLMFVRVPLPPRVNAGQLHDSLARLGAQLIGMTLDGLSERTIRAIPQPETGVTYAKKIRKEEAYIGWNQPVHAIDCLIRGLSPWPGAYTMLDKEVIKILEAEPVIEHKPMSTPGQVMDHQLTIACADGAIRPLKVQRPGKKIMDTEEMLRGYPVPPGTQLG